MRKLAVFVEGQTERIFLERLVTEVAGSKNVLIDSMQATGGRRQARTFSMIRGTRTLTTEKFYVLVVDSTAETRVKSDIIDQYDGLSSAGYEQIIGLRDVRPTFGRHEIAKLERQLPYGVRQKPVVVRFILAVMEVEAWFLGEFTHLARVAPGFRIEDFSARVGFDLRLTNPEDRDAPSSDLSLAYSVGGKAYSKARVAVEATVDAIDYEVLYVDTASRVRSLGKLVEALDGFFR
jgi:hypothetical protein